MQRKFGADTAEIEGTVSGALDSDGNFFPLDSCQITTAKDPTTGQVTQMDATYGGGTWRRTFTYNTNSTVTSQWVKQ